MDQHNSPRTSLQKDNILRTSRDLILKWARVQYIAFQDKLDEQLFQMADKCGNNQDQSRYFHARDEAKRNKKALLDQFLTHCDDAFDNYENLRPTTSDYSIKTTTDEEQLSLVDNNELEQSLALGSMSRRLSADCSEQIYAINQRLSALRGGNKITEMGNPVAPGVFAEGAQKSLEGLMLDNKTLLALLKIFDSIFMHKADKLYGLLNHHFEKLGLLPNLGYEVKKNPVAQLPEELQAQASEDSVSHQISLIETIRQLQLQLRPALATAGVVPATLPTAKIISGLQQLQINAGRQLASLETPQAVIASDTTRLRQEASQAAEKSPEVEKSVVEIVGLLFEYMLNDEQLPDSVKSLLSYLHTPYLKIALIDKEFFNHPQHPARQLLNSLVAAGERWVEPKGKHKNDVYLQIKQVVEKLLNDFNNDVRLFSELAFDFNQYLRQHARRIRLAEKRATQAAQGENKLKEIRLKVNRYLEKKTENSELPEAIRKLLFEPWANFLSFNLLRFGSDSDQWRGAAQTVDEIIAYIHPTINRNMEKRALLASTLPVTLKAGFDTVGYDDSKGQYMLQQLQSIHDSVFNQRSSDTQPNLAKPVETDIDTVLTGDNERQQEVADELVEKLKQLEFGTWFVFNADRSKDQQHRVKLAWSNKITQHFMFVNRMGQQVAVKTAKQLATDIRSGHAVMLSTINEKPFFEQALEKILDGLKTRKNNRQTK